MTIILVPTITIDLPKNHNITYDGNEGNTLANV